MDIVGCSIDLDSGTIAYYLNGNSLGIAFDKINCNEDWFPSISLSTYQSCRVNFGLQEPFRYPVKGFTSLISSKAHMLEVPRNRRTHGFVCQLSIPSEVASPVELITPVLAHEMLSPLMYYEVRFHEDERNLQLFGLASRSSLFAMVKWGKHAAFMEIAVDREFAFASTAVFTGILQKYLPSARDAGPDYVYGINVLQTVRFTSEDGLQENDIVGCGLFTESKIIFTKNGNEIGNLQHSESERVRTMIPFVCNITRAYINVGQYAFRLDRFSADPTLYDTVGTYLQAISVLPDE
jgi:hypothetical protein